MIIKLPIELLEIEDEGIHLLINASVNGKEVRLLIDTGASMTAFDVSRMKKITRSRQIKLDDKLSTGLGTSTMEIHTIKVKEFNVGGIMIKNYRTMLIDMMHVNRSYEMINIPPIDGVLGSDLLLALNAVIDYKKMMLKLEIPKELR